MLTDKSVEYRSLAEAHEQAAAVHLDSLDENHPTQKALIGVLGHLKATIFRAAADILDAISEGGGELSPEQKRMSLNHRLRMAALKGDDATVQAIIDEIGRDVLAGSADHGADDHGSS